MQGMLDETDPLKLAKEDGVLDSAGRLFHSLTARKEKYFHAFAVATLS